MKLLKLPRVFKPGKYNTGDAQDWTYQYTWEDWETANYFPISEKSNPHIALALKLMDYFQAFPEFISDYPKFKGYTREQISNYMLKRKKEWHLSYYEFSELRKLYKEMLKEVNQEEG